MTSVAPPVDESTLARSEVESADAPDTAAVSEVTAAEVTAAAD